MARSDPDLDAMLADAESGDAAARGRLLEYYRGRLKAMVALRMHPRLAARVDPSDVVQETLAEAHRRLAVFLRDRPLPLYPWLRQIAADRLVELHRRHVRSQKRGVGREEPGGLYGAGGAGEELVRRLAASVSSPSARLHREQSGELLRAALGRLAERDREVLVLRHLEGLRPKEIAAVLGVSEAVVHTRHLRALERLRRQLGDESSGEG